MSRICAEVQTQLPSYVDRSLPVLRRRLVGLHLRRCPQCQAEFSLQRKLQQGLGSLQGRDERPPEGLLDSLLAQAARPGVKGRAAVPARGALSGARPTLSVALLVAGAAAGTGVGYGTWRAASRLRALRAAQRP